MKYIVFYETAPDAGASIAELFPAHRARWQGCLEQGTLLAIGPFTDGSGAMGVFTTREAAQEFAAGDPFVPARCRQELVRSGSGTRCCCELSAVAAAALHVPQPEEHQHGDDEPHAVDVPQHGAHDQDHDDNRDDGGELPQGLAA